MTAVLVWSVAAMGMGLAAVVFVYCFFHFEEESLGVIKPWIAVTSSVATVIWVSLVFVFFLWLIVIDPPTVVAWTIKGE